MRWNKELKEPTPNMQGDVCGTWVNFVIRTDTSSACTKLCYLKVGIWRQLKQSLLIQVEIFSLIGSKTNKELCCCWRILICFENVWSWCSSWLYRMHHGYIRGTRGPVFILFCWRGSVRPFHFKYRILVKARPELRCSLLLGSERSLVK